MLQEYPFCVCVDVGSDTCLKSPELVHNLGRVFGTVPDADAYASECCGVGNGGGSGENRQRECWPVGVTYRARTLFAFILPSWQ